MTDPYKVLGIEYNASEDDIKKAYRRLSRQYHPDANINNPDADQAEEKFKEVQAAYKQIMLEREQGIYGSADSYARQQSYTQNGGYYQNGSYQGQTQYRDPFEEMFGRAFYGNFGGFNPYGTPEWQQSYNGEDLVRMQAASNYLSNGAFHEAQTVLDTVIDRQAHWYYFYSLAASGLGNNVNALNYARQAASLAPGNITYQQLIHTLESGGRTYQNRSDLYGGRVFNLNNLCCYCCMLQMCMPGCFCYF